MLECSPIVNSRIRLRISSSISVISERLMSGSTSCSRVRIALWDWRSFDDVFDHRLGGEAVARGVRPQPEPVAEHVRREILDIFRIHLVAPAHQQRPYLGEAPPDDDRARRRA